MMRFQIKEHVRMYTITHKDILYKLRLKIIEFITDIAMTTNKQTNEVIETIQYLAS